MECVWSSKQIETNVHNSESSHSTQTAMEWLLVAHVASQRSKPAYQRHQNPLGTSSELKQHQDLPVASSSLHSAMLHVPSDMAVLGLKHGDLDFLQNFGASWAVLKGWHIVIVALFSTRFGCRLFSYWRHAIHLRMKLTIGTVFCQSRLYAILVMPIDFFRG